MQRLNFLAIAVISLLGVSFTAAPFAADVNFSGALEADYSTWIEKKDFKPHNEGNQDISLQANIGLDENVSVSVAGAARGGLVRHPQEGVAMDSSEGRWPSFDFDGILFQWQVTRQVKVLFGDLSYSAGAFSYYFWRNDRYFASVLKEQSLRGLGLEMGGGFLYLGAPESSAKAALVAVSYPFALLNATDHKLVITPTFDFQMGGGRGHNYTFATDIQYSRAFTAWNYGARGVFGARPYHGNVTYTLMLEPSLNYGSFSIAATGYMAVLAQEDSSVTVQTDAPDQTMLYVEPSFQILPKFSLGVSAEWHRPTAKDKDQDWWQYGPVAYLYPTDKMSLALWAGWRLRTGADVPAMGISGSVEF